ncbi:MAG TPA: PAS domain-containing protein [Burkholderiaceae bacterium]|nr:PAS domain-containing protein [Burkholderiaceae bacterium]
MNLAGTLASLGLRQWSGRNVTWIGALFIGTTVALAGYDIVRGYQLTVAENGRLLETGAQIIAEQTARSMQAVDVVLRNLAEQYRRGELKNLSPRELNALLRDRAGGLVQADGIGLHDAQGNAVALSWMFPVNEDGANISGREQFKSVRDHASADLVVGDAVQSYTDHQWFFPISRRLQAPNGEFAGMLTARGAIDYYQQFYRDIQPDPSMKVTLMHRDGTLLARYPPVEAAFGKRYPVLDEMLAARAAGAPPPLHQVSPLDGVDRFGAVRPVPNYPLVVFVTRDVAVALAPWRAQAIGTAARTLALAGLAVALLALLKRQFSNLVGARKSLETSQERFALAVAGSDDGIWDWDYRAGIAFGSKRAREIMGLPPGPETQSLDEWFASLEQQLHPDDRPLRIAAIEAHLSGRRPTYEGEYRVRKPDGSYRWVRIRGLCVRREAEKPHRMAGSVSDIDARKRAEASLRQSEERYALAMTGSRNGHWVWDVATDALFVSGTMNQMLGLPEDTQATTRTAYFSQVRMHPDDVAQAKHIEADILCGKSSRADFEYRILLDGGRDVRWILTRAQAFRDAAGKAVRVAGVSVDISERKSTEGALRLSEERYALAMTGSNEGHWVWELEKDELFVSPTMNHIFGLPGDEKITRWSDYFDRVPIPPEDFVEVQKSFREHFTGASERLDIEHRIILQGGAVRWLHSRGQCFRDTRGKPVRMAGATIDISDRKQAEEALRQSEERYALAMTGSNEGHFVWDIDKDELFASAKLNELFGLQPAAGIMKYSEYFARIPTHPDDAARVRKTRDDHVAGLTERLNVEYRIVDPASGAIRWIHTRGQCFRDAAGKAVRLAGSTMDVTDRKRTEEALRESEERFAVSVAGSNDGIVDWDILNDRMYASARAMQILDLDTTDAVRPRAEWRAMLVYHPDDAQRVRDDLRRCLEGDADMRDGEYRVRLRDGSYRWIRHRNKCVRDASGKPIRLSGSVGDIDAQKRAEQALRESEERFALAVAGSDDGIWDWDYEAGRGFGSQRAREILGLPPGPEIMPLPDWFDAFEAQLHPEDIDKRRATIEAHLAGKTDSYEGEYRVRNPDGSYRWISVRGLCVRRGDARPHRMAGSFTDIDARKRAEEALRLSEQRYAIAVTGTHEGHWVWDLTTDQVFVSPLLNELFDLPPETQVVPHIAEFFQNSPVHHDDRERLDHMVADHIAGRTPRLDVEYRVVNKRTGQVRWVHSRAQVFRDADGKPERMGGATVDVTERRRAEAALRESEERYALAIAHTNDGIIDWDIVNDRMFLSERAMRVLGIESDQTVRTRDETIELVHMHPDDVENVELTFRRNQSGVSEVREGDCRVRRADGEYRWVRIRGKHVRDVNGRATRWVGSISDIDAQKRTEEALRRSEERYQLAVDGSNEGLWDWDLTNDTLFLSPRAQEILWLEPGEPLRSRREWVDRTPYHPDDVALVRKAISDHLKGRTPHFTIEYRLRHHSGAWNWYRQRGIALRDENGIPFRMAGSMENITARKNAEAQRDRLEVQLRQAQKLEAIGTLAGGIAHDFNNILAAILGYGEMAQKDAPDGTALRRHIDAALSAGMRAKSLVERILAFSRSGIGDRVPVHVQSVVSEALDLVAASLPTGVQLRRELNAGDAAVLGDPIQVHQVVMNLCANAIQAMKSRGAITVALDVQDLQEKIVTTSVLAAGRYVRLQVRDSGSGIPPHVLERIFDPFFTTKEVGVGTGLGLSLVHGIVADLGGGIDIESRVGEGSTFTVYMPWQRNVAAPQAVAEGVQPGTGETILLVDDEETLVRLGEEMIAELGYEPVGFTSSVAALATFRAAPERFNAVLSDEAMPDMTGSELALEIRKIRPDIPIVLMTGYVTTALSSRARDAGVVEVLNKPLVRRDIARSLAGALRP